MKYYESAEQALQGALIDIIAKGGKSSPRNRSTKEFIAHSFAISNPRHRLVSLGGRQQNIYFALGNVFWVLGQSNELEHIKYYNPRGVNFSDDGKILRGGYGKRIFDVDGVNQWYQAVRELKIDPDSRRAIISIHLPQHDWRGSLDTPCTSDIQFMIREDKLIAINHMRSQSTAMVMPYDLVLMTMLHELTACELDIELGTFYQFSNSLHYYTVEETMVRGIISSSDYGVSMPPMPAGTKYDNIKIINKFEKYAREAALNGTAEINDLLMELLNYNFNKYWNDICYILIAKAMDYINDKVGLERVVDTYLKHTVYAKFFDKA